MSSISPISHQFWATRGERWLLTTWSMTGHGLLSHSGYVSIYDIKMEYPNNSVIQGSSPEGGVHACTCAHPCFIFIFFPLSHTLILFISAEKFVEIYYLQLWEKRNKSCVTFLLFVSFFPSSSCNILVFTVVSSVHLQSCAYNKIKNLYRSR